MMFPVSGTSLPPTDEISYCTECGTQVKVIQSFLGKIYICPKDFNHYREEVMLYG